MKYKLHTDYKDTRWLREAFYKFTQQVFGLSFKEWTEAGLWNDQYICYSLVDDNEIISNVSLSKLQVLIDGQIKDAIQLATVGTLEEYRGQGLSRYLMEKVLKEYEEEYDLFFLSANNSVVDFYPRFGFQRVSEYKFIARKPQVIEKSGIRKLDLDRVEDFGLIKELCEKRVPVTDYFGAIDYSHIFVWYLLNFHGDSIFYIQEKETIVICNTKENCLHIYDILSPDEFDFREILSYLPTRESDSIRFHFTPDKINMDFNSQPIVESDPFFVRGDFGLEGTPFKFPQLAQT